MLLYWGLFTLGFFAGAILSFKLFAAKKPEDEQSPATFVLINNQKDAQKLADEKPTLPAKPIPQLKES